MQTGLKLETWETKIVVTKHRKKPCKNKQNDSLRLQMKKMNL